MHSAAPASAKRKRDKLTGLAIIVLTFAGCMGLSVWGMMASTPQAVPAPAAPTQEGIVGYPQFVHPFELLETARALSVREKFRGFSAQGVEADGSLDLSKKGRSIRYAFQSNSGRGPQPLREPGTLPQRRFCGVQSVMLDEKGIGALPDDAERPCPSQPLRDLVPPAHCSLQAVLALAKKSKFDPKVRTRVEFYQSVAGPAFRLVQKKKTVVISAQDCKTILKGRRGRGSVP